ncbi:MAG: FecR domain-containing protein [Cytophagales bacterium]|nr:FecR domain-containing protein [Cytophagales bacterium]
MKDEDYIKKWLEGTLTEEDERAFKGSEQQKSLDRLSRALPAFKAPEYDVADELSRLEQARTSKAEEGRIVPMKWMKPLLRVAAVFVLLSVVYVFLTRDALTTVETLVAEKTEIVLPDSSLVTLNAHSRLMYPTKKWKDKRKVTLDGEGFFKVAKGSRFDVETSSGVVRVLGTEFNVKNRENYFEVICYEGLVQVQSAQQVVKLNPNQMFRIINGEVTTEALSLQVSPSWLAGESSFSSVPLKYVIQEFERQYDVSVIIKNVDIDQRFTGAFIHNDITLALKAISLPVNIDYQLEENKQVILSGK